MNDKDTDMSIYPPPGQKANHVELTPFDLKNIILPDYVVEELENSIKNQRWFEGIVLSASYYESLAVEKIDQYLKSKGKSIDVKKFKRFYLHRLLIFLYSHSMIAEKEYSQMIELNKTRDKIVHREEQSIDPIYAEKLIRHGINCFIWLRKRKF